MASASRGGSTITDSSDDAVVGKDLNGVITAWNAASERMFGHTSEEIVGKPVILLIPQDRRDEEHEILERVRRGQHVQYETVRRRKDGSPVEVLVTVVPVRDTQGAITGAVKIARDITERRWAQERQAILLEEINHRIKNLFAITESLVAMAARSAPTPKALAEAVKDRLGALSRAHALIRPGLDGLAGSVVADTTLDALVGAIFAPYHRGRHGGRDCLIVNGPDVPIGGNAVTQLALVLHELATNAVKHGALSYPEGCVLVGWLVEGGGLDLHWEERGGPPLAGPPSREGFGGAMTLGIVTYQFGGQISQEWKTEGLIVRLSLPVARLAN